MTDLLSTPNSSPIHNSEPDSDAEDRGPFHEFTPLGVKRICVDCGREVPACTCTPSPFTLMSPQPRYQRATAPGKVKRIYSPIRQVELFKRQRLPATPEPRTSDESKASDHNEASPVMSDPLDRTTPKTVDPLKPSFPGYNAGEEVLLEELETGDMFVPEEWINDVGGLTQKPICVNGIEVTNRGKNIMYVRVDQPKLVYYAGKLEDDTRYFKVFPYSIPNPDGRLNFYSFERDPPLWANNDDDFPFAAINIIPSSNHYLTQGSILYFSHHNAICVWDKSEENDGFEYFEV